MNSLVVINKENALEVFTGEKLEDFLKEIEEDALRFVADVNTTEGRKQIASKAYEIAQAKTKIDSIGKELVSDWKEKSKLVDNSRKKSRDFLDELKLKVRKPLTEWEQAEKEREERERLEAEILLAHTEALKENEIYDKEKEIERKELELKLAEEKRLEEERLEAEKIAEEKRQKQLEIERIEREKQIAENARIQAQKEAEEKIEAEKRKRIEAELKAKQDQENAIKQERERLQKIEAERIETERIEKEKAEKKANNLRHQERIKKESIADFMSDGFTENEAKRIIELINSGNIRNITINY